MKKDKIEVLLFILMVVFALAGCFFYYQSKQIVLTTEIPYSEVGSINYKVYLNDNTYYDKEYLDEGMQYISTIIDYVDVDFKYNASYEDVSDYSVDKNIIANVIITDSEDGDKIIYNKAETIKEEHNDLDKLDTSENVKIDYKKYNNLVNDIKTKYGISASSLLRIEYNVTYSSKKANFNNSKKLTIDIPLSKQMINITKGDGINNNGVYTVQSSETFVNGVMTLCMVIMVLLSISSFSVLILRVRDRIRKESKYDRFIAKVLKEYDSYITEAREDSYISSKDIIKINSFKELLDVRNNIDKTIVYTKLDDNTSKFQIIDEEIYEYKVTREEMDN